MQQEQNQEQDQEQERCWHKNTGWISPSYLWEGKKTPWEGGESDPSERASLPHLCRRGWRSNVWWRPRGTRLPWTGARLLTSSWHSPYLQSPGPSIPTLWPPARLQVVFTPAPSCVWCLSVWSCQCSNHPPGPFPQLAVIDLCFVKAPPFSAFQILASNCFVIVFPQGFSSSQF